MKQTLTQSTVIPKGWHPKPPEEHRLYLQWLADLQYWQILMGIIKIK